MKKMNVILMITMFILGMGLVSASTAAVVYVRKAPPARKTVVVKPARPHHDSVWVSGHWGWRNGVHIWVDGKWISSKKGHVWIDGHWKKTAKGWIWVDGHWKKR